MTSTWELHKQIQMAYQVWSPCWAIVSVGFFLLRSAGTLKHLKHRTEMHGVNPAWGCCIIKRLRLLQISLGTLACPQSSAKRRKATEKHGFQVFNTFKAVLEALSPPKRPTTPPRPCQTANSYPAWKDVYEHWKYIYIELERGFVALCYWLSKALQSAFVLHLLPRTWPAEWMQKHGWTFVKQNGIADRAWITKYRASISPRPQGAPAFQQFGRFLPN